MPDKTKIMWVDQNKISKKKLPLEWKLLQRGLVDCINSEKK